MQQAFIEAVKEQDNLKIMPNGYLAPSNPAYMPGAVVIGDALNMRHPLTGGISILLIVRRNDGGSV